VILLDNDESRPFVVTDTVSFADQLKTTVAGLPAPRSRQSDFISALALSRLVCDVPGSEVQQFYAACLPTQPALKWVCAGPKIVCFPTQNVQ